MDRPIEAVLESGQRPTRHALWHEWELLECACDILRFEETTKPGQMSPVPWIIAHHRDGSTTEINVALLTSIERAAPEEDE